MFEIYEESLILKATRMKCLSADMSGHSRLHYNSYIGDMCQDKNKDFPTTDEHYRITFKSIVAVRQK